MPEKDQKLVRHKEAQRRRAYRNQNPTLELCQEKVKLDDNVWGDQTTNKLERVISNNTIQEQKRRKIKEKSIQINCIEKNDEGLLHKVKMFFKREKPVNDTNQKLIEKNEDKDAKNQKHHSKKNSKKVNLKNKSLELGPINGEIQKVIMPNKNDKNCLVVKDLYRRKKTENDPEQEHKSNPARKKTKNISEGMGPNEQYLPLIKSTCSEHNTKITNPKNNQGLIINELTIESIKTKLEEKIKHELQDELKHFSCRLESIFNEKFELFLHGYEQQREKRRKEKKERAKTSNNEDCKNPKEKIIIDVLQWLMNGNNFNTNFSSAQQDSTSVTDSGKLLENKSNALPIRNLPQHVAKSSFVKEEFKKLRRQLKRETVPLVNIISEITNASQIQNPKEKRNNFSAKARHKDNQELIISPPEKFRNAQRQLNYETVPIINIFPGTANSIQTEYDGERQRSSSAKGKNVSKPKHELIISPPERFKNQQRQMNVNTVPIINILPQTKENQKNSCATKHEDNKNIIIVLPVQFKNSQLNSSMISILPETINTIEARNRKAKEQSSTSERKNMLPRHIMPPIMSNRKPPNNRLKLDTLSVFAIYPKPLKTTQTQTSYKCLVEKRKTSKRFRSYYQYHLARDSREKTIDFSKIVSDRNMIGSSLEEEQPEVEKIYSGPQKFSVSEDSNHSRNIGEGPLTSHESVAGSSYGRLMTSLDNGKVSNFKRRRNVRDGNGKCISLHKNIPQTNSKNYVVASKYENQYETNKRIFLNNAKVFKRSEAKPKKSYLQETFTRLPSVDTIEASVGSAILIEDDFFNITSLYENVENLEEDVEGNLKGPVVTVDAAIGSKTLDMSQEKEYREMSVGSKQLFKSKTPQPHKSTPVTPTGFRRNAVCSNMASINKSKIPIQQVKPDRFTKNAFVRPSADITRIRQTTTSLRRAARARPTIIPKKEPCYYRLKPQTPRAKPPTCKSRLETSAPIHESPRIDNVSEIRESHVKFEAVNLQTPRTKPPRPESPAPIQESPRIEEETSNTQVDFEATEPIKLRTPRKKSSSSLSTTKSPQQKSPRNEILMEKFRNFPQTRVKSRAAFRHVTRNDPAIDEVSTYEKRKRYDRGLRKMIKNHKNKKSIKISREPVKTQKSQKYNKSKPCEVRAVLHETVECVDSCLIQMNGSGTLSSDKTMKLAVLLQQLPVPVISNIFNDNLSRFRPNYLTFKNSVEFLYSSSKYSSSSKDICSDDDDNQNILNNVRVYVASFSCPSLLEKSSTFEYLYEAPTPISSTSMTGNIIYF
ncbi:unnamed protein product [Ceutorhynchus assimilis]|uniref:Uncharacterized protein n=1 Tax=Ceutorhynchus assimilis TaxID=467358 RepID=A0A9N9QMJ7_9CUCU|nr:unnamed protein product [Ceutorhynchus assimilis]